MSQPVVEARALSKRYRLGAIGATRIVDEAARWWARARGGGDARPRGELWALRDVSFSVDDGEALGIIGRNGAGKSTLLKILSRITEPTAGEARLRGRVASLLEIGTGFHPELTGRENIFLNGMILGMTKAEIARKLDAIVAFAEIERFLDTPVKRYSSGMYVRLAFAVAAHLEPKILIVDEVLAVGDAAFQRKCLGKMGDVAHSGRTVLFVSHNMQAIRTLCRTALWLDGGRVQAIGPSAEVVEAYLRAVESSERRAVSDLDRVIDAFPHDASCRLLHVALEQDGAVTSTLRSDRAAEVVVDVDVFKETFGLHVTVELYDMEGAMLWESINNGDAAEPPLVAPGRYRWRMILPEEFLAARRYELAIDLSIANVRHCIPERVRVPFDVHASGRVNRAYPGYVTPGKLAPLFDWKMEILG